MQDTEWLSRTELLIGSEALHDLSRRHVLVIGLGGVGSFAAEFIARAGIGTMTIVDGDTIEASNRNRQLPALTSNMGKMKASVMAERLKDINPELKLMVHETFVNPESVEKVLDENVFDYIIDAIDSITPKLNFLVQAHAKKIPIVSSMGAGGKMDPTQIKVVDISETHTCPFAHQIRKNLRQQGIHNGFKAVFSTEPNNKNSLLLTDGKNYKKSAYGTISYLPAAFGAVCASVVIQHFTNLTKTTANSHLPYGGIIKTSEKPVSL